MARAISITLNLGLTGLVHLLCCWLPLVVVVFNGTAITWLAAYRNELIVLQIAVFAWSFYDLFLRKSHQATRLEKTVFGLSIILSLVFYLIPHDYFQPEESRLAQNQFKLVTGTRVAKFELQKPIKSLGQINTSLQAVEGVIPSQIQIKSNIISVRYHLGKTSEATLLEILRREGYQVSMIN